MDDGVVVHLYRRRPNVAVKGVGAATRNLAVAVMAGGGAQMLGRPLQLAGCGVVPNGHLLPDVPAHVGRGDPSR